MSAGRELLVAFLAGLVGNTVVAPLLGRVLLDAFGGLLFLMLGVARAVMTLRGSSEGLRRVEAWGEKYLRDQGSPVARGATGTLLLLASTFGSGGTVWCWLHAVLPSSARGPASWAAFGAAMLPLLQVLVWWTTYGAMALPGLVLGVLAVRGRKIPFSIIEPMVTAGLLGTVGAVSGMLLGQHLP